MGNQPSSRLRGPPRIRSDVSNALGLSKAELDERCKPSGLYSTCNWDEKTIRRLIGDGKLASRPSSKETDGQHECPICFFHYSQINVTVCCQASICTECYLQLQPYQKPNASSTAHKPAKTQVNVCPFCNAPKLSVTVAQMKTPDPPPPPVIPEAPESNPSNAPPSPTTGFGSSLAQNPRVAMMRARSCSVASSSNDETTNEMACMTPQERHVLENEMRAQHLHPLALRLEQEEAERRLRNELEYAARRGGTASSSLHPRPARPPPPLALPGLTEEQQMALAIAASLQESARTPSTESA